MSDASTPDSGVHGRGRRVLVIGSGFGGLAAAIRLQAAGVETTLLEARDKPGGRAYVYEQDGFTFDAGPTVITAPHTLEEVFAAAGRTMDEYVRLVPVTPFYRLLWEDGDSFDYGGDADAMERQIGARAPEDVEGYRAFVEYTRRVFMKGYEELAAEPFLRFTDMVKVAPDLVRLRADRPVYSTVSRFVKDEHLRQALSFHSLLVGGNPFDTSSIYTLIHYLERKWGVFFPLGGTGALVRGLMRLFEDLGGRVRLSCPVQHVTVHAAADGSPIHRVESAAGVEEYDAVVSNADVHHTYSKLYAGIPAAARRTRKLEKLDWSMSLFVLYFGVDRVYPDVAHHTVVFGQRYEALLHEIFNGPRLPADFSLYLHSPSVTDASLAPPGCSSFYVLSPVPHLGKTNTDWEHEAERYADAILGSLERHLPDLRRHVITRRWVTPRDFERDLAAYKGSAFSVAPRLTQSAWFRPHNKDADIPGLYLVGAGTHPGAGVPGVVSSAKATARLVLDDMASRPATAATRREPAA
jgi:phytoene desaturase